MGTPVRSLFIGLQLCLKPTEVCIGLGLVAKESFLEVPRTQHELCVGRWVVLLGLEHLVHALAEAGEACVLATHGDASHLAWHIFVGADAALPSVADGGGAFQACVSLGTREAVFAGLEGCVAFVAGPDADSVVGRHCGEEDGWMSAEKNPVQIEVVDELCRSRSQAEALYCFSSASEPLAKPTD